MAKTKYRPKYARELRNGLRKDGISQLEVCDVWNIAPQTYENWVKEYPDFAEAHEIGKRDAAIWWHKLNRSVASGESPGNPTLIANSLKYIEGIKWTEKSEVSDSRPLDLRAITIQVLPIPQYTLPPATRVIDAEQD